MNEVHGTNEPATKPITRVLALVVAASGGLGTGLFIAQRFQGGEILPTAIWRVSAYLTDWSNVLAAGVCLAIAFGCTRLATPFWRLLATSAIVVMAVLFALIGGWANLGAQDASSLLTHIVTPASMLLLWTFFLPHGGLYWRHIVGVAVFPIAYLAWTFARGLMGGGYPYPEIDPAKVGWGGSAVFSASSLILFLIIGSALIVLDRGLARRRTRVRHPL